MGGLILMIDLNTFLIGGRGKIVSPLCKPSLTFDLSVFGLLVSMI